MGDQWMKDVLAALGGGEVQFGDAYTAKAVINNDADKGLFVLKLKDSAITESINYLKGKGLLPDRISEMKQDCEGSLIRVDLKTLSGESLGQLELDASSNGQHVKESAAKLVPNCRSI